MSEPVRAARRRQQGITGLETAIILIAFVVVASVFAFTVISTGIFSSERSKETVHAGLEEARSTLEPRGTVIVFKGDLSDGTDAIYKVSMVVGGAVSGEPIDMTPPYSADGALTDPDVSASAQYKLVVSYTDDKQHLSDVPWTVNWVGYSNGDNILDAGEQAELTVWLVDRINGTAIGSDGAIALMNGAGDGGGAGGITATSTVLGVNSEFTLVIRPSTGAVMIIERTTPARLQAINDLK